MVGGNRCVLDRILVCGEGNEYIRLGMAVVGLAADDYVESMVALRRNEKYYADSIERIRMLEEDTADIRKEYRSAFGEYHAIKHEHDRYEKRKKKDYDTFVDLKERLAKAEKRAEKAKADFESISEINEEIKSLLPIEREYNKHKRMVDDCKRFFESGDAAYYVYDLDTYGLLQRLDGKVDKLLKRYKEAETRG